MDAPALALFGLIRATRAFETKGTVCPAPLPTTARAAAANAAEALTKLLLGHANRSDQPVALSLRGLREHIREMDGLIVRGAGMPADLLLPLWRYRCELVGVMQPFEGGPELAEVLDMLPEGVRARSLAEEAALRPPPPPPARKPPEPPPSAEDRRRGPARPQPDPVPAETPPPTLPDPGEKAPVPAEAAKAPEPAAAAAFTDDGLMRFRPASPPPPAVPAAEEETLELTKDMLAGPPPAFASKNAPPPEPQKLDRFTRAMVAIHNAIDPPKGNPA